MMKTLNKLAAIALLVGAGQTFAGDDLSANLHTAEPDSLQASAMEIMSADELSAVRGDTFFAPLTPNQVVIAIAGFAAQAAGGGGHLNIAVGYPTAGTDDIVVCNNQFDKLNGTTLATSQISAGNYANHRLSAADVGLSFGLGVGMPLMSRNCTNSQFAIKNQVMLSEITAAAITERKQLKRSRAKTSQELLLLGQTWNKEDGWFKWGVTQAGAARDNIKQAAKVLSINTIAQQLSCPGDLSRNPRDNEYCASLLGTITAQNMIITEEGKNFKFYAVQAGKAAAEHATTIGLKYEAIKFHNPTYGISNQ